jgi:hypothetical protein
MAVGIAFADRPKRPMNLVVSALSDHDGPVEFVERKGLGHPDSICDALAQNLSRNLCRHYLDRFGTILHHNVDKALLVGRNPSVGSRHDSRRRRFGPHRRDGHRRFAPVAAQEPARL